MAENAVLPVPPGTAPAVTPPPPTHGPPFSPAPTHSSHGTLQAPKQAPAAAAPGGKEAEETEVLESIQSDDWEQAPRGPRGASPVGAGSKQQALTKGHLGGSSSAADHHKDFADVPSRATTPTSGRMLLLERDHSKSGPVVAPSSSLKRGTGIFPLRNFDAIKDEVRKAKAAQNGPYDVKNFYHSEGVFQAIVRDARFENFTLGVIACNAAWIAVDTDWNHADSLAEADPVFIAADVVFFAYFTMEILFRFFAFRKKRDCLRDAWFVFDSFLVALYAFDPFIIGLIAAGGGGFSGGAVPRLLRLARLSRLVRMFRATPELMIMIKGIIVALASVSYALGLLLLVTYVFAIVLTMLARGTVFGEDYLSSVGHSMYTLILYCTFLDDLSQYADAVREESTLCLVISSLFIVFGSMTIMNMLIGIMCEVIQAVAETERQSMLTDRVYQKFLRIARTMDMNRDSKISWQEFDAMAGMPEAINAFESVNVEVELVHDFAQDWFYNEDGRPRDVELHHFMEMILDLRSGKDVTIRDLMVANRRLNRRFSELEVFIASVEQKVDAFVQQITQG